MIKIYNSITELVGQTPLLRLGNLTTKLKLNAEILAKCEMYNPLFSVKDRVALAMIEAAEKKGVTKDTVFVEATSGNTGIGLAGICAARGYRLIIVMPENMSAEKISLIRQFGAEVMLTPATDGMQGSLNKIAILKQRNNNLIEFKQFSNIANIEAHQLTTAAEIIQDLSGNVDAIVCAVGTAGTLTGLASTIKSYNPDLYVMAVEPAESAVLSGKPKGVHRIGGIGAGFVPPFYKPDLVNEVFTVSSEAAFNMTKIIAQTEGIPAGVSSSAALISAINLAKREEMNGKNIVVIFPDSIERYLSDSFFKFKNQGEL